MLVLVLVLVAVVRFCGVGGVDIGGGDDGSVVLVVVTNHFRL